MFKKILLIALAVNLAFAAGGIDKVNTLAQDIESALFGVSIIAITIAFGIAGYRMAILKQQWTEVLPVVIGGVVIGSASSLAALLVG
ncbi:TrbC/VirB2 family protein [Campylobacter lari]|uniref:Attachment mediating protein TraC/VirB2 n=2 Tax=Campylobacter lari TaxID=201 RepID=B9KGH3_CAMLR|nr:MULTISPECIES: TrbC/VirB2 family protein [Campylobacter]ACM64880.1 attachment mediating protein TraC/VirB2 [Campylobacter lari RM2100]EAC1840643.1 conjugal transfer protein TraC [Campylobacter lari]EAH7781094.1 conjugal transfer protein TraC [Campylobacter lari]EAH8420755.1 conjugal transfer protein TraC [Campylobacter lari]EAI0904438.1 conjugal transfer protein TraC [Campylobacter lari]